MNNIVMIAAVDAESAAKAAGPSAEEKLKAAMGATASHWMATNEEEQFAAACEGAARCLGEDDRERIEAFFRISGALNSAAAGIPVDWEAMMPEDGETPEGFPLQKWWREIKDAAR